MTFKVLITETWYLEADAISDKHGIDAVRYARKNGVIDASYVSIEESSVTMADYLNGIERLKRERRIEANRKKANLPPKPGKMARGRPRKEPLDSGGENIGPL